MTSTKKFGLLRKLLRALGFSHEAADKIVNRILGLFAGNKHKVESQTPEFRLDLPDHLLTLGQDDVDLPIIEFPYHLRDHFLTPAELSFFQVLQTIVRNRAVVCAKVALGDVFWVKRDDPSHFRIYTNKIDRKHVDFLLCHPATMQPLVGVELDDRSHLRTDRQARDAFVDEVFKAAGLPLLHVPVKRGYDTTELAAQLAPYLSAASELSKPPAEPVKLPEAAVHSPSNEAPRCPKCGSPMILRTAKSGANAGSHFWGCSNYPNCRSIMPYTE
jgi:hypothetical protein